MTDELKAYAAEIGISATGVTAFDEKFTFDEHVGKAVGDHVVVCVLEQNYDATQRIPAMRSQEAALAAYGELDDRMVLPHAFHREAGGALRRSRSDCRRLGLVTIPVGEHAALRPAAGRSAAVVLRMRMAIT